MSRFCEASAGREYHDIAMMMMMMKRRRMTLMMRMKRRKIIIKRICKESYRPS